MSDNKYADAFKDEDEEEHFCGEFDDGCVLDGFTQCPECKAHIPTKEWESHFCKESPPEDDSDNTDGDGEDEEVATVNTCVKCGGYIWLNAEKKTLCFNCEAKMNKEGGIDLPLTPAQINAKKKKEKQQEQESIVGKEYDEFSNHITIQKWQYVKLPPIARTAILSVIRLSLVYRKSVERWLAKDASMVKDARVFTMPYVCSGFEKDETGHVVPKSMLGGEEGEDGVAHLDIARALPDHAHFCVLSKEGDPVSHLSACAEYYENPQKAGVMRVVMHGPLAKLKVEPEQGYSLLFGVDAFSDTLAITQIPNDSAAHEKLHETS